MADELTHLDQTGTARMVDVGAKPDSERIAIAGGSVTMQPQTLRLIRDGAIKKGDVLTIARIAWWWFADRKPLPVAGHLSVAIMRIRRRSRATNT